ncbi:MAG: helix-turn-helix transcriptional regulator [Planctomycetaceae bacterium]
MNKPLSLAEWMRKRDLALPQLVELCGLDKSVVEAIVAGRYTTSPKHRQHLADALQVQTTDIIWSGTVQVDHMSGHGPQFGRSP